MLRRLLRSNGAYRLLNWEVGSYIELERNEYYWDNANTDIDRVRHYVTPEQMVELNRYLAGELHVTRTIPPLTREASLSASGGDPEPLRDGCDRPDEEAGNEHAWFVGPGNWAELCFDQPHRLEHCRIVFDSDLRRKHLSVGGRQLPDGGTNTPPPTLVKAFRLLVRAADGSWTEAARITENHQRLARVPLAVETDAIRLVIDETWGAEQTRVFGFEVE